MKAGEISRACEAADEWRMAEAKIAEARAGLAAEVRGRGGSWDSVGYLLGTTGSAARQRFGGRS